MFKTICAIADDVVVDGAAAGFGGYYYKPPPVTRVDILSTTTTSMAGGEDPMCSASGTLHASPHIVVGVHGREGHHRLGVYPRVRHEEGSVKTARGNREELFDT